MQCLNHSLAATSTRPLPIALPVATNATIKRSTKDHCGLATVINAAAVLAPCGKRAGPLGLSGSAMCGGFQHFVDPGLPAGAARAEAFDHVAVNPQADELLVRSRWASARFGKAARICAGISPPVFARAKSSALHSGLSSSLISISPFTSPIPDPSRTARRAFR